MRNLKLRQEEDMIPTIEDIVAGLIAGTYTQEQAMFWIHQHVSHGYDLSQYAAMAMQGLLVNPDNYIPKDVASSSLKYAEALLSALQERK